MGIKGRYKNGPDQDEIKSAMELMADITFTGQDISLVVCKISLSIIIEFCLTQVIDAKITHEVFSFNRRQIFVPIHHI